MTEFLNSLKADLLDRRLLPVSRSSAWSCWPRSPTPCSAGAPAPRPPAASATVAPATAGSCDQP